MLEGVSVDVGKIVPEVGILEGVLKLSDLRERAVGGDLDGDTTTIGVGAPVLRVSTTVGSELLSRTSNVGDRGKVDGETARVLDDGLSSRSSGGKGGKQHSCARDHVVNHFEYCGGWIFCCCERCDDDQ